MADDKNMLSVTIKWNKETLPPVQIDTSEAPAVFKSQLWTLTGVPPERQTILGFKGGKLKDDGDWAQIKPKDGMKIILLGTVDESRVAPPPVSSDLPRVHDDLDMSADDEGYYDQLPAGPPGLKNLGNTCYMNATVQCLNSVSPLTNALSTYRGSTTALNPAEKLAASLRDVFSRLKSANSPSVNPFAFHSVLRQVNPQFAERGQNGIFAQQDAEECWGELLTRLASALTSPADDNSNHIDDLFSFCMRSEDRCTESDEVIERFEDVRALKCHISVNVSHLQQGIKEGLEETIEKRSETLGRSAQWNRTSKMHTLPPFLIVQYVRFFWKPAEAVKAKILRRVSFPIVLDVFDYCSDQLKEGLKTKRDAAVASSAPGTAKESSNGSSSSSKDASAAGAASASAPSTAATEKGEDKPEESSVMQTLSARAEAKAQADTGEIKAEIGNYELCAVLTHKGRAADSGHYVAWVKTDDKWYQFDDEKVTVHPEEDVKKLCGGGDWHMAYMCLYRAKNEM